MCSHALSSPSAKFLSEEKFPENFRGFSGFSSLSIVLLQVVLSSPLRATALEEATRKGMRGGV
jgi:hypothetical protein